jgi:hypothetical protein
MATPRYEASELAKSGAGALHRGDPAAAIAAADRALALDPGNLRALILKADCLAAAGDARASSFYLVAVRGAGSADSYPAELRGELARAQTMCERYAAKFADFLRDRMSIAGMGDGLSSRRFRQGLDILLGKRGIYVQQPRYFYFPGLPQVEFAAREDFPWLDALEAATGEIREEVLPILSDASAFTPYVQSDPSRPYKPQVGMADNPDWSAFYLWKNGQVVGENASRCPRTIAALEAVPLARTPNRSPSVLLSLLRPGARIPPHTGLVNTRFIGHLPLVIPPGCGFRVGGEVREWAEGKAWLFDDTIEHEAWNASDRARVILIFEIWRPDLTAEERALVNAMFAAIDAHAGQAPAWEI